MVQFTITIKIDEHRTVKKAAKKPLKKSPNKPANKPAEKPANILWCVHADGTRVPLRDAWGNYIPASSLDRSLAAKQKMEESKKKEEEEKKKKEDDKPPEGCTYYYLRDDGTYGPEKPEPKEKEETQPHVLYDYRPDGRYELSRPKDEDFMTNEHSEYLW